MVINDHWVSTFKEAVATCMAQGQHTPQEMDINPEYLRQKLQAVAEVDAAYVRYLRMYITATTAISVSLVCICMCVLCICVLVRMYVHYFCEYNAFNFNVDMQIYLAIYSLYFSGLSSE
jgi:hypothetical protein